MEIKWGAICFDLFRSLHGVCRRITTNTHSLNGSWLGLGLTTAPHPLYNAMTLGNWNVPIHKDTTEKDASYILLKPLYLNYPRQKCKITTLILQADLALRPLWKDKLPKLAALFLFSISDETVAYQENVFGVTVFCSRQGESSKLKLVHSYRFYLYLLKKCLEKYLISV